nr:hypothetical protein HUO10_000023 [Paraburkholderia busanensis]
MAILSLALYGSRARHDEDAQSDVDLFAISDDDQYQMIVQSKTNIASYPRELALERAKQGDLFMLHIVSESKTLYDTNNELLTLKNSFVFKNSYLPEIKFASDIAHMLIDHANTSNNYSFINKRIAWCVRTILIAQAANERLSIFSAARLAEFSKSPLTLPLIKGKNNNEFKSNALRDFGLFITQFGTAESLQRHQKSLSDYSDLFSKSQNIMGTKTLTMLQNSAEDFYN